MEIQNNKEEIPFSYYADLFSKADPAEISARLDIPCEDNTFRVTLLGTSCTVSYPSAEVTPALPIPTQTYLIRYLLEGKRIPWQNTWKTFREMPWGELYIKPYTGRVLTRAAFTFGTRLAAFKAACEKMGAKSVPNGDAGFEFAFLGGYKVRVLVWEGDDEFPPNAQILYSDNFETGFAPEDRVVTGDILITAIRSNM